MGGAQRPTSIRQSQNLQKQSLPQFQASQQSKSRLWWPLTIQVQSPKSKFLSKKFSKYLILSKVFKFILQSVGIKRKNSS